MTSLKPFRCGDCNSIIAHVIDIPKTEGVPLCKRCAKAWKTKFKNRVHQPCRNCGVLVSTKDDDGLPKCWRCDVSTGEK